METELIICNIEASKEHVDAPNFAVFEMSPKIDETDRNTLSKVSKFEHRRKHFPESQSFLMQVLSCCNSGAQSLQVGGTIVHTNSACSSATEHLNNNIFCENVETKMKLTHAKSKFDTQSAKNGYVCSTYLHGHTLAIETLSITTTLPQFCNRPLTKAMLIGRLRIVDIPAAYLIHFDIRVDAGIECLSYTCSVSKAENGHTPGVIDSSALHKELSGPLIPTCTLKSSQSQSLVRFNESSNTITALPTSHHDQSLCEFLIEVNSFVVHLERKLLLCDTNELTKCETAAFQALSYLVLQYINRINCLMSLFEWEESRAPMLAVPSSTVGTPCKALSLRARIKSVMCIPLKIKKLLIKAQRDDEKITKNSLIFQVLSNDKEEALVQYSYITGKISHGTELPATSTATIHTLEVHGFPFNAVQQNEFTDSTSIPIMRANPSKNQGDVHSRCLSFKTMAVVTSSQDFFESFFQILTAMSPQCFLSCISTSVISAANLVRRSSVTEVEKFEDLQLLSLCSGNTQLQIKAISDLGMSNLHRKVDMAKGNSSNYRSRIRKSYQTSQSNRRIPKNKINKIRSPVSFPKRCQYRTDRKGTHHLYLKMLGRQFRGKKMNSISLKKGLRFCAAHLHSSLKYQHIERCSSYAADSGRSSRSKQASDSVISPTIEKLQASGRNVALFRGDKQPFTRKSNPSSASSDHDDSDSDSDHAVKEKPQIVSGTHTGADNASTSEQKIHENPSSSHEASHSNGAMNVRPSLEGPSPLKMNSGVSHPGGEADRHLQNQSPAALITKSSKQLLHSQGVCKSNNCTESQKNEQVPSPLLAGVPDLCIQPKLECYENERPPITPPRVLEQAQEEAAPALAYGRHNECVLMRTRHRDHADQNNPAQCAMVASCPIPMSNSITGPGTVGFGAIVEAEASSATALPCCRARAVNNYEYQLKLVQQQLRSLVLLIRFRCHRISRQLLRSQNLYNHRLQIIRCTLRDIVSELCCIHCRWNASQLLFESIRALLLHTNYQPCHTERLFELQQLSALHAWRSLLCLRPQLEHIITLCSELLSQLQQANAVAQIHAPPLAQANPQQAAMFPALLSGPGNVMPFQAQAEEGNTSLVHSHSNNN